jgi:hypothetical protein
VTPRLLHIHNKILLSLPQDDRNRVISTMEFFVDVSGSRERGGTTKQNCEHVADLCYSCGGGVYGLAAYYFLRLLKLLQKAAGLRGRSGFSRSSMASEIFRESLLQVFRPLRHENDTHCANPCHWPVGAGHMTLSRSPDPVPAIIHRGFQ